MKIYHLMHKNIICGIISFDEENGKVELYKDLQTGHSPFLGNADTKKIKKWWEMRAVPASRTMIQKLVNTTECVNAETYLEKNLALSMTDSYWVRPIDSDLTYEQVKFPNLAPYNKGKIPYHNASTYDMNASLGGQMEKYWDLSGECPVLVKESYKYYGQQSLNEVFATTLHESQKTNIPFVHYTAERTEDNGVMCKCKAFTSDKIELIPAIEVIESEKKDNSISVYDFYIEQCVKNGIPKNIIQDFMDYQTLTDFIISNTDEHLSNFAVLRDSDTMEILGPAPIFDSGNSMFYSDAVGQRYDRVSILERPITGMAKSEDKLIQKIRDKNIVDVECLPDSKFVIDFYTKNGVPEKKATSIAFNYDIKLEFVKEMQAGVKISLYLEKQKAKEKSIEYLPEDDLERTEELPHDNIPYAGDDDDEPELED